MQQLESDKKRDFFSISQAILVFLVLFAMLVALVLMYDFSNLNLGALSFILALTCSVLIAKNIYDLASREERDRLLAEKVKEGTVSYSSQKLFSEIYDNSPIAYVVMDSESYIVSVNIAAARLLGRPVAKLVNTQFFSCLSNDNSEHIVLIKEKFKNGISVANEEIKIKHERGVSWANLSIFQFKDAVGQKTSLVTLVDVTKQKEVDIAKTEFVSLASHQLRTPIAGMRWSAELLEMDEVNNLTKQQKRYVDRLLSNIKKMSSLIDDFLQVSRFDLGTRTLQLEKTNIKDLLEEMMEEQVLVTSNKNIETKKSFGDRIENILIDDNLFRMIATNIYGNAIKYTNDGGRVELSCEFDGENLVFAVKDNGMGIPISEQSRIFTKIFRASNATREVPDGTGLGLYIAKKATQVMRGKINFVSEENRGTTFTVVIPVTEA